jgi:hypothetical protein
LKLDRASRSTRGRSGIPRRVIGTQQITVRQTGRHIHRWSRHEHHVIHAYCTTIGNSRVVMPPNARHLANSIPDWLRDFVQVIDGDIIRERINECDYRLEAWEDVRTHDVPIYGCEPAIVIGEYVMTGWGPSEVHAEQHRSAAEERASRRAETGKVALAERCAWWVVFIGTLGGGLWLTDAVLSASSPSPMWAALLLLASLYAMTQVVRARCLACGLPCGAPQIVASAALAAGFIGAGLLFVFGQRIGGLGAWTGGAVLLLASIIGLWVANRWLWPASQR